VESFDERQNRRRVEATEEIRDLLRQFLDDWRKVNLAVAGFRITETALQSDIGGNNMDRSKMKATVDFEILDDGKGVLYTLTPVNTAGNPMPLPGGNTLSGVSAAPASLANPIADPGDPNATPPRLPDTTGLVFLSTVPKPVVDAVGIVVTFTDTQTGGTLLTAVANAIDVDADNSLAGFTISETAL
jgi:hypothetical protein